MKKLLLILAIGCVLSCTTDNHSSKTECTSTKFIHAEKIQFPSLDSLTITANLYHNDNTLPVIVLCHQAGFNKFEYTKIAQTLHEKGYNCIAIDQRSGGHVLESFNETFSVAEQNGASVEFVDAEQDIIAAINYASKRYNKNIILWGSSYSATLALHNINENKNIDAVIAFSPGSYLDPFKGSLKDKLNITEMPMFITSSKEEAGEITALLEGSQLNENQIHFIPKEEGSHGSSALWKTGKNNQEYWQAIFNFLERINI